LEEELGWSIVGSGDDGLEEEAVDGGVVVEGVDGGEREDGARVCAWCARDEPQGNELVDVRWLRRWWCVVRRRSGAGETRDDDA
jgi:hypothetical protein